MSENTDRSRGMLTSNDRDLLKGNIEYDHKQQYSNRYQDIRERIANALLDFNVIQYNLRDKDRKLIFSEPSKVVGIDEPFFTESIRSMVYWTYFGLKEQNYNFESLIIDALVEAEKDFARKYWGESVEVDVRFDVDVNRSHSVDDVIKSIENGGPVRANRVYELLQLSGGVPIDTSELETVNIFLNPTYPEGEKAVIQTLFSEYLGVDVNVQDAEKRAVAVGRDNTIIERDNATIDPDTVKRPDPAEIKGKKSHTTDPPEIDLTLRPPQQIPRDTNQRNEAIDSWTLFLEEIELDEDRNSITEYIRDRENSGTRGTPVTADGILKLLQEIEECFVTTEEVSAVFGCPADAAKSELINLHDEEKIKRRVANVGSSDGIDLWWLPRDDSG